MKLFVIGFGSGEKKHMTQQAVSALKQSDLVIGYTTYIEILKKDFPDLHYLATPMRKEIDRCKMAVQETLKNQTVALVSSGDSGIYGMAGILLEIVHEMQMENQIEIEIVPGITAASLAASVLGAPLMHDFAVISLSDLLTPLELIYKRVSCAAQADFVICLY
ncbi:MAG: precorrin-3B C(17)-methyltransferase, partial [Oscillospiraceae bacterium]|nr:precorrin-3B C(17)-methyltransferase [Oscillospiraceae bacterium]